MAPTGHAVEDEPRSNAARAAPVVDDADWPNTKRLQPWLVAVLLVTVFLVPIDSIKLPISLPVDARPDRIVLLACLGLSIVVLALRPKEAQRVGHRYGLIDITIFLFIAVAVMSVALNLDTLQALNQVAPTIKRFAVIFAYAAFFLIVVNIVRVSELDAFIRLVIVLATIAAAGTVLQYATGFNAFFWFFEKVLPPGTSFTGNSSLRVSNGRPDITGPTRHGLAVCTMIAMFIPFALTRAIDAVKRRDRLLYAAAAVVMVIGCVCTLRRTGVILPFVAVSAVVAFGGRRMLPVAIAAALLIALAPVVVPGTVSQLRYQFSSENTANQQSSAGRRADYGAIVPDLRANTLLGRGYATYDASRYRYLDNQYLGTMIGIGAIGTGLYVLMMATAGGFALRIGRRMRGSPGAVGLAAAGAILAFAVANALFDTLAFPQAPYAFFLVLAFVAILRRRPDVLEAESRSGRAATLAAAPPTGPVPPRHGAHEMSATRPARIALAFDGDPRDRSLWSGTPFGVLHGLQAAGVEVHPIDCSLPPRLRDALALSLAPPLVRHASDATFEGRLRSAYGAARIGPHVARVQSRLAARRFARLPAVDGVVQIGTGYRVPRVAPIVTYEDMTIVQALRYPFRHWSTMPQRHIDRRIALQRRCYADAHAHAVMSSWAAHSVRGDYGASAADVVVAGVGSHDPRRAVQRDWSTPRFLFVGVDWERKNGPRVLEGFARVREQWPAATLDVVGGHPPIDARGVTGHGIVRRDEAGGDERLRALFDRATCFVMPSLFEPAGIVYNEAMACGLPVMGTTSGGARTMVGDAGVSVDPEDTAAIADAMVALADPDRASAFGAVAYARAPLFTWENVAERLLGAIDPGILGRPLTAPLPS